MSWKLTWRAESQNPAPSQSRGDGSADQLLGSRVPDTGGQFEGSTGRRVFNCDERSYHWVPAVDEERLAAVRTTWGEEAFAAAWAEGQRMSREEAVSYALDQV
jgi:hypothetical protein